MDDYVVSWMAVFSPLQDGAVSIVPENFSRKGLSMALDDEVIDQIKAWNGARFHQRVIAHIEKCKLRPAVIAAMRKLGNQHAREWFDRVATGEPARSLAFARFETIARLNLVLHELREPLDLLELLSGSDISKQNASLRRLEEQVSAMNSAESLIRRVIPDLVKEFHEVLHEELAEIEDSVSEISRDYGFVSGREIRIIGEHSKHIRVMTSRLDFGVEWDDKTGEPSKRADFKHVANRLASVRHTFIVPGDGDDEISPSPFAERTIRWSDRVDKFMTFYDGEYPLTNRWNDEVIFRQTHLPIPAGAVLFGLSSDGYRQLREQHPDLVQQLQVPPLILESDDGGAFVGVAIPGSPVPNLRSLLNRRAIFYACRAFIKYWNALESAQMSAGCGRPNGQAHSFDPRIGLPIGPNREFRS